MPSNRIMFRVAQGPTKRLEAWAASEKISVNDLCKAIVLTSLGSKEWSLGEPPAEVKAEPEPEVTPAEEEMVDLAPFVAEREQVSVQVAKRWIEGGYVKIDVGELEGEVWQEGRIPRELLADVLVARQLTRAEKARQKALRDKRLAAAEKHKVAVGHIGEDGEPLPGAPLGSLDHAAKKS